MKTEMNLITLALVLALFAGLWFARDSANPAPMTMVPVGKVLVSVPLPVR